MGTPFSSPEKPAGYRSSLAGAQGGVRDIENIGGLLGGLSEEAQQLIIESVPLFRTACHGDNQCVVGEIQKIKEVSNSLPKGWTHDDMIREMRRHIEHLQGSIEQGEKLPPAETIH